MVAADTGSTILRGAGDSGRYAMLTNAGVGGLSTFNGLEMEELGHWWLRELGRSKLGRDKSGELGRDVIRMGPCCDNGSEYVEECRLEILGASRLRSFGLQYL